MVGKGASPGHRSGEIARRAGVRTDTLRHYERKGLLAKPRRLGNGYRVYPGEALAGPEIRSFILRAVAFDRRGKRKEQK